MGNAPNPWDIGKGVPPGSTTSRKKRIIISITRDLEFLLPQEGVGAR